MANSAPVEVWEKILRYSIAVPLFFDSDLTVEDGLECLPRDCFEAEYWDSERTRNNCRRVCRSWDTFLQQYDHRYVRLSDIYYGKISLEVMSMAIRLNVSISSPKRFNRDMGIHPEFDRTLASVTAYLTPTGGYRELVKEWRTEILEGYTFGQSVSSLEHAPRLRAVLAPAPGEVRVRASGLRFLYTHPIRANASSEPLVLQHLTTLHLISHHNSFKDISFKDWRLPSLQHLTIKRHLEEQVGCGDIMLEVVRAIGKNLITLHFVLVIEDGPAPNIWPHIPHVERIQLPYWKGTLIPADHPTRIVIIPIEHLSWSIKNGIGQPAMDLFDRLPHPKQFFFHSLIVKMDFTWIAVSMKETVHISCGYQPYHSIASAIWLAGYYEHLGVEFTDAEGVDLQDYLVFAIKFYWKGRRASVHKPKGYTATTLDF